jgi:hypothetical protein
MTIAVLPEIVDAVAGAVDPDFHDSAALRSKK